MDMQRFHIRLEETIAWCSLRDLQIHPRDTEEFEKRQLLLAKRLELLRRADQLEQQAGIRSWLSGLWSGRHEDPKDLRRQAWELDVASVPPLNRQLRTPELRPVPFFRPDEDLAGLVQELAERRAGLLRQRAAYPARIRGRVAGGELLVYEPDDNVEDGASQYQSQGYFDGKDAPPWDTWVCYVNRHLVSWVAPSWMDLVKRGIEVNCVDCLRLVEGDYIEELCATR